ncbi:MAG TPA: nucleotidyltransferase domain-containing protein [Actinomycetota bacterium]|nr:nucleotidyltransferase domain-containing protein [Actinomycetota bacterium]
MADPVEERLRRAAPAAFEGSGVVFAYLFGSRATGHARPDSDVDVAVYLDPPPEDPLAAALALAGRLEERSGVGGIEVVVMNAAPLPLLGRILRERIVIFSRDEPARVAFESLTFREFQDFDLHARELDRELLRRHAEGRR